MCISILKNIVIDVGSSKAATQERKRVGRKLDHTRDAGILDATLVVLADSGYEGMTIDMVAARAKAARATVYRRWATKADLVLEAVARLSQGDVDLAQLPDTGSLREDMIVMILPLTGEQEQARILVMTGLHALAKSEPRLAKAAAGAGIGPWIEVNRMLIQRAIDRGEFPPSDVDALAQVIPTMCAGRAGQQLPITREFSLAMIDSVIIPALRGGG